MTNFPASGVNYSPLIPPLVALAISALTTPAGVSGAFLLLPFQVSVLGFVSPAASATNLVFNIVATPGGLYRYVKEGRMVWPLAWAIVLGTLPGVFLGALIRVRYLSDPRSFKIFAGCVLLWLGVRLLWQAAHRADLRWKRSLAQEEPNAAIAVVAVSTGRVEYKFGKQLLSFNPRVLLLLSFVVGLAGGAYGIGGGAIIAPFLVAVAGLPLYTVAGACLLATFLTSVAGVAFFEVLGLTALSAGVQVRPDWALGALFGVGGLFGAYLGARLQKFLPERWIRLILGALVAGVAAGYIGQSLF